MSKRCEKEKDTGIMNLFGKVLLCPHHSVFASALERFPQLSGHRENNIYSVYDISVFIILFSSSCLQCAQGISITFSMLLIADEIKMKINKKGDTFS